MPQPTLKPFFARSAVMARLRARVEQPGITFVTGKPQCGKGTILNRLTDQLRAASPASLVGLAVASKGEQDLLLASIKSLWSTWLADSSFYQQAGVVARQQAPGAVARVGTWALQLLVKVTAEVNLPGVSVGRDIESAVQGIQRTNDDLRSGGLMLQPVAYEQALDLVRIVADVSKRPIVLMLDAWDQSAKPDAEFGTFKRYLDCSDDWPSNLHFIVSIRDHEPRDPAYSCAEDLKAQSSLAQLIPVSQLEVDGETLQNVQARDDIVAHVRSIAPGAAGLDWKDLDKLIGGHAGVLARWASAKPSTRHELHKVAGDAHAYRYDELRKLMHELASTPDDRLKAGLRLALCPELTHAEPWRVLEPAILEGLQADCITQLRALGVLDASTTQYPSFGHTTRYEFMRRVVFDQAGTLPLKLRPYAQAEAKALSRSLAARITTFDDRLAPFAAALASLHEALIAVEE